MVFEGVYVVPITLIRNALVVTMDPSQRVIEEGNILIEDGKIASVQPARSGPAPQADKVIDASGLIAMPGLVQTHVHLCQVLFRGLSDDMELLDWLRLRTWPLEAAHDEESVYYSALLGTGEMLKAGVTSIIDMQTVHHAEAGFRAIEESGIRAVTGKVMMDVGTGCRSGLGVGGAVN